MQIQLEIINRTGLEPGILTRFAVGDAPIVIGRGKKADWELPDASRFLSSAHCRVSPAGEGFIISVLSANGIELNGKSLAQGADARLSDGDRLEIGPYLILASHWLTSADGGEKTVLLRRQTNEAADERTVIQRQKRPAAVASATVPHGMKPDSAARAPSSPPPHRAPSAARAALGVEFVREFAVGAGIDPEILAGRTNLEFAAELGGVVRSAMLGVGALGHSADELRALVGSRSVFAEAPARETDGSRMLAWLFAVSGSQYKRAPQAVGDLADALLAHEAAMFHAMQTALFRLLNELAPMTIETGTRTSALRSKKAGNWDRYVNVWEGLSIGRENGMLDVFLEYFRDAYDDRMGGH